MDGENTKMGEIINACLGENPEGKGLLGKYILNLG
jgi:hypothetical protein